jgi:nuclear pore complex protein Nup85
MDEKQYGLAISYYTSAEDWPGLGRVIDQVLHEYISQGPAKFTSLVAEIAPSLQTLRSAADSSDYPMHGIFLHRLMFIVKYAEFHQRKMSSDLVEAAADLISMFEDDIAPTSWWGVLLQDSVEFLNYRECYSVPDPARLSPFWISRWHAFYISEHRAVAS